MILGIDEAGRGPVVGPLIVAGVLIEQKKERWLRKIDVKDSKKLSSKKREEIFEKMIGEKIRFRFIEIQPEQIDRFSLNYLEALASVEIIKQFYTKKIRAFVDVPAFGIGIERYCARIKQSLKDLDVELIGGNKMDETNIVVSAASIVAKVIRDRKIKELQKVYGDFGSGYPTKKTVSFIKRNYKKMEPIVRKKWSTIRRMNSGA